MPDADIADTDLLARFVAAGDEEAFARIVERHGGLVFGVCLRQLRDRHLAEDAFQQTWLALARSAERIQCGDSLAPWLHTTAWRMAKDYATQAHRRRERMTEQVIMEESVPGPGPELAQLRDETRDILDEELAALPERERSMLLLRYIEGRTRADCARALRIPIGSTSDLLRRASDLLRHRLAKRGFTVGGVLLAGLLRSAAAQVPDGLQQTVIQRACDQGAVGSVGSTGLAGLGAGSLVLSAGIGLLALAGGWWWFGEPAAAAPTVLRESSFGIDPYQPAAWEVEPGVTLAIDRLAGVDQADGRVVHLVGRQGGQARLRMTEHLPASFRFRYSFLAGAPPPQPSGIDRGGWNQRTLEYRLRDDGQGYLVRERYGDGREQQTGDDLVFSKGDPFAFQLGSGTGIYLRAISIEPLPAR